MEPQFEEEIIRHNPNWYYNIKEFLESKKPKKAFIENNGIDFDADIGNFDTCIVGEIHGFTASYGNMTTEFYCRVCEELGNNLNKSFSDNMPKNFEIYLKELYDHIDNTGHEYEEIE